MTESRLIGIRKTLYARVPAEEARRLGLRPGQQVDLEVRPLGATAEEILALRGRYKGHFVRRTGRGLWGE